MCLSVCLCGGVCVAGLFAMVLCRVARQRLTGRGGRVKRRHSLCWRNRLRRSGWTHHRNILGHPDLSSTRIMNILYHHIVHYNNTTQLVYVCVGTSGEQGGPIRKNSWKCSGQEVHNNTYWKLYELLHSNIRCMYV